MRGTLLLAVIAAALAAGWLLLGPGLAQAPPFEPEPFEPGPGVVSSEVPEAWMLLRFGTLTLNVGSEDGRVPTGTQVGFETPKGPKFYYVPPEGTRTFTDVPLGDVVVLAQAPGYRLLRRPTRVEAGVPGELRLVLEPESSTASGPR